MRKKLVFVFLMFLTVSGCSGASKTSLPSDPSPTAVPDTIGEITESGDLSKPTNMDAETVTPGALQETAQKEDFVINNGILLHYIGADTEIVIPDEVKEIAEKAFESSASKPLQITKVTIPNSVTKIGAGAFRDCTELKIVDGMRSVQQLGSCAFEGCVKLEKIDLDMVENIGMGAFHRCESLTEIVLSKQVNKLGENTFDGCKKLCKINLDNVEKIGDYAFYNCEKLTEWGSLKNVISLGVEAFLGTPMLKNAQMQDGMVLVDGILFDGRSLKGTVNIPDGVRVIAPLAFESNYEIEELILPDSVVFIGSGAFYYNSLKKVWMDDSVSEMGVDPFEGCFGLQDIRLSQSLTGLDFMFLQSKIKTVTLPERLMEIDIDGLEDFEPPVTPELQKITISLQTSSEIYKKFATHNDCKNVQLYTTNPEVLDADLKAYLQENGKQVQKLALTKTELQMKKGQTETVEMNSSAKCHWESSNPFVVTVTDDGEVTAIHEGVAVIRAMIYGEEYTCEVTVR